MDTQPQIHDVVVSSDGDYSELVQIKSAGQRDLTVTCMRGCDTFGLVPFSNSELSLPMPKTMLDQAILADVIVPGTCEVIVSLSLREGRNVRIRYRISPTAGKAGWMRTMQYSYMVSPSRDMAAKIADSLSESFGFRKESELGISGGRGIDCRLVRTSSIESGEVYPERKDDSSEDGKRIRICWKSHSGERIPGEGRILGSSAYLEDNQYGTIKTAADAALFSNGLKPLMTGDSKAIYDSIVLNMEI